MRTQRMAMRIRGAGSPADLWGVNFWVYVSLLLVPSACGLDSRDGSIMLGDEDDLASSAGTASPAMMIAAPVTQPAQSHATEPAPVDNHLPGPPAIGQTPTFDPLPAAMSQAESSSSPVTGPSASSPGADVAQSPATSDEQTSPSEMAPDVYWPTDCDYRYIVRAHSAAAENAPFEVAPSSEYTVAFVARPPWQGTDVQFVKARPIVDNSAIVHHWTLFAVDSVGIRDGDVQGGPGQPTPLKGLGEQYIIGGSLGTTEDLDLPDDVGLRVPRGPNVMQRLEVHYVNSGAEPAFDASGFEVCMTSHKRPKEAAAHWLGTLLINVPAASEAEASTTCRPYLQSEPVHVMSVAPHMHRSGVHATMTIERGDGSQETLIDAPYDFQHQTAYTVPMDGSTPEVVVHPGDAIKSTCRFLNQGATPIVWGERSTDEMCFMVVFAWPTGQLVNGSLLGGLVGAGPDVTCLEP